MVPSGLCRLVLLLLFSLLVVSVQTETVLNPSLTSRDHQDTMSGDPPVEGTTKTPFLVFTGHPVTEDYEDATLSPTLEEDEGVLGPGAITAIVIAVFLGASVLLALIIITIRKFTAS
ncbi:protein SNORC [Nematolebias whitei]|uniref:protein SNORC n=1 Tax=Nematolebias whitei TaxID=451745 RepID=UPI0018999E01|nr:protein SNORC [Nematolebias whitei]